MTESATNTRPPTPFKELDFFVENDAPMFAGRERETRQLVSRIVKSRAIVVHARSGLGKTSLLRAGVIPLLLQQNFRPVYVRILDSLLGDLTEAVMKDCSSPPAPADGDPEVRARNVIEAAATGGPLVLVLDQFEEFFTRFEHQPRERQAFVQFITGIVRDESRDVRVVFSLREDYLYALDEFQRKLPELFSQAFRLLPLTPLGARDAIIRPLVRDGVRYDEALITQLIDDLTGFDFDSARLQVTCSEVYRHALAGANGSFGLATADLDSLKEEGGVSGLSGIYKRYLREAVAHIPEALHLDTKLLLDKLITAKRTKFAISRDALEEEFGDLARVDPVLVALERQKLIRRERRGEKEWFELRHECLVEGILDWFKEDRTFDSFRFVRELIEEHSRGERFRTRPEMLLTIDQLSALAPLHERLKLTPEQWEYVMQSAVYQESPETPTWAKARPSGVTDSLLRTLMESPLPQMKLGAVGALRLIGTIAPDLRASCLNLAIEEDTPRELRLAARTSAASLVTETELAVVHPLVRLGRTPAHVREFLSDLYEQGRMGKEFGGLRRWLSKRQLMRRRFRLYSELRPTFIWRGVIGGICGSVIFAVAASMFVVGKIANLKLITQTLPILLSLLGAAVVVGLVFGCRDGGAAFRVCAMGSTRWKAASAPFFSPILLAILSGGSISLGVAAMSVGSSFAAMMFGFAPLQYLIIWVLLRLSLTPFVMLAEPFVRKRSTVQRRILSASVICLLPALALVLWNQDSFFPGDSSVWTKLVVGLLYLLYIDLCSFSLAFPVGGIEGARPVPRSQKAIPSY